MKPFTSPLRLAPLALALVALASATAFGQGAKVRIEQLDKLAPKAAESVEVTIDGALLEMASRFLSQDQSEDGKKVREVVAGIKGIYVRSYEFDSDGAYTPADLESVRSQLSAPGWARIVNVRSRIGGDNAEIYVLTEAGKVAGVTILAANPRELTVVNIVGEIDVEKLSQLEGSFGIPRRKLERQNAEPKN